MTTWDALFAQLLALRHQIEAVIATADALRGPDAPTEAPNAPPTESPVGPSPDVQTFFGRARARREAAQQADQPTTTDPGASHDTP